MLALVTTLKEKAEVNGIPIKEWFIQNTDISCVVCVLFDITIELIHRHFLLKF